MNKYTNYKENLERIVTHADTHIRVSLMENKLYDLSHDKLYDHIELILPLCTGLYGAFHTLRANDTIKLIHDSLVDITTKYPQCYTQEAQLGLYSKGIRAIQALAFVVEEFSKPEQCKSVLSLARDINLLLIVGYLYHKKGNIQYIDVSKLIEKAIKGGK